MHFKGVAVAFSHFLSGNWATRYSVTPTSYQYEFCTVTRWQKNSPLRLNKSDKQYQMPCFQGVQEEAAHFFNIQFKRVGLN